MRPVSWSTSYLLRCPLGISTRTSNSTACLHRRDAVWVSLPHYGSSTHRMGAWVPEGDGTHVPRLPVEIAVVLVLLLTAVSYWADLGDRLGIAAPDPHEEPALVEPPVAVDLPAPASARPVAAEVTGGDLSARAVRSSVAGLTRAKKLGPRLALVVTDVDGTPVHRQGPRQV